MIFPDIRLARAVDGVDFSDVTTAQQVGPAFWHQTDPTALVVPFDPEPTTDEWRAIRRRLVTADVVEEEHLYALLAAAQDAGTPTWARALIATELARYGE